MPIPVTVVLKLSWQILHEASPIRFFISLKQENVKHKYTTRQATALTYGTDHLPTMLHPWLSQHIPEDFCFLFLICSTIHETISKMVLLFEMVTMMFQRNPERERERERDVWLCWQKDGDKLGQGSWRCCW